ncbi:Maf-domain-containing protein [Lophiostoma macrostomum CBS 122681]|uniref:Maf-domain-containing protein n=1 Tax=Lophiostoma macrostomum CBS 122681 TaxID=1314788 RepID=A0A6A6TSK0_9PLEO|nr:Maf-domain-containing protein [Lophiostoma macrostomum CBS 122681]
MTTPSEPPPPYEDAARPRSGGPSPRPPLTSPRGPPPPKLPLPLNLPALVALRGKRIVLASASPRRRQLLAQIGLTNLDIVPSRFAEDLPHSLSPFEYVLETASEKVREVYTREIDNTEKGEPALIIAADTIIISTNGKILEKPRSEADHYQMLQTLRDEGSHRVATAVAIMTPLESAMDPGYRMETHVETTTVTFDPTGMPPPPFFSAPVGCLYHTMLTMLVTDELILAYVRTRDGADKAGGYGIQTAGSILIEKIDGSYDNVVGLPLRATLKLIEKVMEPESDLDDEIIKSDDEDFE